MVREIEIERTARVLKQAEPGHAPPRAPFSSPATSSSEGPWIFAVICGILTFIAVIAAIAGR